MADARAPWWQTVPGILTALAGAVTAVGGLLLTLNQIGLIGARDGPAPSPSTGDQPVASGPSAAGPEAPPPAAGGPSQYSVEFTAGTEVKLRNHRADGVYTILGATVANRNTGTLTLTVSVRLTNVGRLDIAFSTEHFRLIVDAAPRAPTSTLIGAVDARSAEDADITFDLPVAARSLVLSIDNGEDRGDLPLALKKSG